MKAEARGRSPIRNIILTLGDPAGISGEIIVAAWKQLQRATSPLARDIVSLKKKKKVNIYVAGDAGYLSLIKKKLHSSIPLAPTSSYYPSVRPFTSIDLFDLTAIDMKRFRFGEPCYGEESMRYLDFAIDESRAGRVSAIVTAPITKESAAKHVPGFLGHTDYLAEKLNTTVYRMAFATPSYLLVLQTIHLPLADVSRHLSVASIAESIAVLHAAGKRIYGGGVPIAVLALNPHAGEHGLMGTEEAEKIIPAIKRMRSKGIRVDGPFPADSFFIDRWRQYKLILAMYHDQGLVAVKTMFPRASVNVTLGLPVIRTSVDHGSAYDIAGKGVATPDGLLTALKTALEHLR
ncbi:MAG: 4-hydroxythreonine-4-phosphate dehydrogenase PdxA [Spirochaetes bacterium]|nr:4-hydroxythreonine-4-phosphate dehydrogenase PdxA [Spirochaetota bacterium]